MNEQDEDGTGCASWLQALADLSHVVAQSTASVDALHSALSIITRMLQAEGALLWIVDEEKQNLVKRSSFHLEDALNSKAYEQHNVDNQLEFGQEFAGEVWAAAKPKLLQEPAMFGQSPNPGAQGNQISADPICTIAFPIFGGEKTNGVIEVIGCGVQRFNPELESTLKIVSGIVGPYLAAASEHLSLSRMKQKIAEATEANATLEGSLQQVKLRLSLEHEQSMKTSSYAAERLRKISQEIRTPLNGIVGVVGIMQRSDLPPEHQEFPFIINESVAVLLSVLDELVDLANREQSFAPEAVLAVADSSKPDETSSAQPSSLGSTTPVAPGKIGSPPPSPVKGETPDRGEKSPSYAPTPVKSVAKALSAARILVLSGIVGSAEFIEAYVSSAGIKCGSSSRGRSGLMKLRQALSSGNPYDLVFVEMVLPDMDALEFARIVKQDQSLSHTNLVLVSTFGASTGDDRAFHYGFSRHIAKPVKQSQLIAIISNVLAGNGSPTTASSAQQQLLDRVSGRGKGTILVAEDNPVNQKVALLQLKDLGFYAKAVTNGQEALEAIQQGDYDAILMDCQMPTVDGYEATKLIRAAEEGTSRHVPIIAMTAHVLATDRDRCFATGMDDYLSKPVTYEKLDSVLSRWVSLGDNRRAGDTAMTESAQPNRDLSSFSPSMQHSSPVIDVSQLEEMLGSEETGEILNLFVTSTEELLVRIDTALAGKDSKALREAAHELKGACSSVGAASMAQSCFELEQAARNEEWDTVPNLQIGLTETFESARVYIETLSH